MCSPFWVSFFREINWQSEKIYQHIARLSDKLKLWGNQLWPCRCVQPPTTTIATSPQCPRAWEKLGGSNAVHLFIYLRRSFISRYKWPWRLTTTESPTPPPSDRTCLRGGGDYHKKHTNQRGTMNPVTGRRRKAEVWTFFHFVGGPLCMLQLGPRTQSTTWWDLTR